MLVLVQFFSLITATVGIIVLFLSPMKAKLILADSGGTSTDWAVIKEDNTISYFTTKSYHPSNFSEAFFDGMLEDWNFRRVDFNAKLKFFGAGCSSVDVQKQMTKHLTDIGFREVEIQTDAYGACLSQLGHNKGLLAVMGTGSVVCSYNGLIIDKVYGGLGHVLGDEGSGYFFGKLVIKQLLSSGFSGEVGTALHDILGDRRAILKKVYSPTGKDFMAHIPKKIAELTYHPELVVLHRYNFELFVSRCLFPVETNNKRLNVVGSYAFYHKDILEEALLSNAWKLESITKQPIKGLAEYFLKNTF
jgi:glucosamine kinase